MNSKLLMIQGTSSGAGKSIIVTALGRILTNRGFRVAPFKSQNMSSFTFKIKDSNKIIANAQAIQSLACKTNPNPNMNPILLEPLGNNESNVYVNGDFFAKMKAQQYYSDFVLKTGFRLALAAFKELQKDFDIILLEGAGSPAEINIQKYDIANMLFASTVKSPVILVSDIERGGCFASILGTMMLLKPSHQKLVKGIMINKFRGDNEILAPAIKKIESKTKKPVLGIIPKIDHNIPQEDSLDGDNSHILDIGRQNRVKEKNRNKKTSYSKKIIKFIPSASASASADMFSFSHAILDQEIDRFADMIESFINFDYIMDKIIIK
ncbi:MAG TPA: cobyric acid synthase [Candidatus Saccharimonadales bacterium]|nr:cobyric acid synthase [Candidatus Saccharimonadales bacterium]